MDITKNHINIICFLLAKGKKNQNSLVAPLTVLFASSKLKLIFMTRSYKYTFQKYNYNLTQKIGCQS